MYMFWGPLLLSLTGLFATGVSYYLHRQTQQLKFLGLQLASVVFVVVELAVLAQMFINADVAAFITELIIEWGHIYCIALILSSLLLFVRESKPEFSRFPRIYAILPLLVILSYLLVYDTILLKKWLLNLYQGGAAVVTAMMYGIYYYRDSIYLTVACGAAFFLASYLIYIFIPVSPFAWQICLAVSITTTFSGYLIVEKEYSR